MAGVEDTMPVRIGAICRDAMFPYPDNKPGEEPRTIDYCRFTALTYMPIGGRGLPEPFDGGVFDPPVEVNTIAAPNNAITAQLLRILHNN